MPVVKWKQSLPLPLIATHPPTKTLVVLKYNIYIYILSVYNYLYSEDYDLNLTPCTLLIYRVSFYILRLADRKSSSKLSNLVISSLSF